MSISITSDTRQVLGDDAGGCASRSLFNDRFAAPQAKEDARKRWFGTLIKKNAEKVSRADWLPANAVQLHARLMSRLMVDLAGGVMENANLNLDRHGLPLIPGSAVKGCARRMALQALHDWNGALASAGQTDFENTDLCAPCCADFTRPVHMLAAIARVFGWIKDDWKADKNRDKKTGEETTWKSDFAWACHGDSDLLAEAKRLAGGHDIFAGTIAFLPASPNADPGLELDVVTPHHTKYHSGEKGYEHAPDTEDPIPVFFPAVKPQPDGDCFSFPLIPLRLAREGDLALAKLWLSHGLELLGLGAKTHAGYGLFQILVEGKPAFDHRFDPILSPVEKFLREWGSKPINGMNARAFAKLVADFGPADLTSILESLAPGKVRDLKDSFWNPFKTDPAGKKIVETLRDHS